MSADRKLIGRAKTLITKLDEFDDACVERGLSGPSQTETFKQALWHWIVDHEYETQPTPSGAEIKGENE